MNYSSRSQQRSSTEPISLLWSPLLSTVQEPNLSTRHPSAAPCQAGIILSIAAPCQAGKA